MNDVIGVQKSSNGEGKFTILLLTLFEQSYSYTKDNHTITNQLCLENAVIANGTWDTGIYVKRDLLSNFTDAEAPIKK